MIKYLLLFTELGIFSKKTIIMLSTSKTCFVKLLLKLFANYFNIYISVSIICFLPHTISACITSLKSRFLFFMNIWSWFWWNGSKMLGQPPRVLWFQFSCSIHAYIITYPHDKSFCQQAIHLLILLFLFHRVDIPSSTLLVIYPMESRRPILI